MRVDLTDDPTAFRARDWSNLVTADRFGTFFHTPEYLKLWWEEFGAGRLVIATVSDEGRPVGACCLQVDGGLLAFLGGFDVTDYMGPVGLPGTEEAVAGAVVDALAREAGWHRADLAGLPAGSPWLPALERAAAGQGLVAERGNDGVTPLLALPGSFDAYLATLPAKLRHEIRRKRRRLAEAPGGYSLTLADERTLPELLERFVALHKSSAGPKGRFMHAGMEIFFRRLAEAFLPPHVLHLAFLDVAGEPAAAVIGFAYKDTFSLYNSAFDRAFSSLSPGMVLVADAIAGAIESGRSTFDMLKGDLGYKYRFGPAPRPVERLLISR